MCIRTPSYEALVFDEYYLYIFAKGHISLSVASTIVGTMIQVQLVGVEL